MKPPQVVAHRGSSAAHRDNSWAAFEAAPIEGADVIECDVQSTRDGVLVIRHDLAVGDRLLCDLSAADLERREPGTVCLEDLLDWAEGERIGLLIEVKDPTSTDAVAAMVVAHAMGDRTVIGGFHGPALAAAKTKRHAIRTSFMVGSVMAPEDLLRVAAAYRVDGLHLCWESRAPRPHRLLDATLIERLRLSGLRTTLWHEEREDELAALVALEPDAICTNTPAVLRRIVDERRARLTARRRDAA